MSDTDTDYPEFVPDAVPESRSPIGVRPEYIWKLHRTQELADGIQRYVQAGCYRSCVAEWSRELAKLIEEQVTP